MVAPRAEEDAQQHRFASLLQPIKDLAQTWSVDIATELEQYLEELAEIEVTVESAGKFNFVEAALLIQGSTTVYSKKVELLHQLVYQALEHVVAKKESKDGRVKLVQSIEDHTHLVALRVAPGKDLEHAELDGASGAPGLRRMPLFLMPREKTDRKRISHKIGGCAFVKSAVLLEESDALKFTLKDDGEPHTPLLPPPPMAPATGKKLRESAPEPPALVPEEVGGDVPATGNDAADEGAPELPEPDEVEYEEAWVQMDAHEDVGKGKPLKEGKVVSKPPPRLLRALAETDLTDPFNDSDLYEVAPLKGILRRIGLEGMQDCEFLVVAEMRRQRRKKAEERKARNEHKPLPEDDVDFDPLDLPDDGPADEPEDLVAAPTPFRAPAPGIAYTPGSVSEAQVNDIAAKILAAQKSYELVVQQRLDELQIFEGAHGGLATVYANVRKWQDGLEPLLAEQDAREQFDIHAYGSFILEKIRENTEEKVGFQSIVEGLPVWQVYRYFLAALVLTNNGNLNVFSDEEAFALGLLDGNKAYALEGQEDLLKDKDEAAPAPEAEPAPKRSKGEKQEPQDDPVEAKVRAHKKGRKAEAAAEAEEEEEAPAEVDPAPAKRRRKVQ